MGSLTDQCLSPVRVARQGHSLLAVVIHSGAHCYGRVRTTYPRATAMAQPRTIAITSTLPEDDQRGLLGVNWIQLLYPESDPATKEPFCGRLSDPADISLRPQSSRAGVPDCMRFHQRLCRGDRLSWCTRPGQERNPCARRADHRDGGPVAGVGEVQKPA
jgi:hypothetical protein